MTIRKVERDRDNIFIKELSKPDLAGNRHMIVIVQLVASDVVVNANGSVTELRYLEDKDILEAID